MPIQHGLAARLPVCKRWSKTTPRNAEVADALSESCSEVQAMTNEVARLRAVVDELARSMQKHSDAVRVLADAVQMLTATRHRP